MALHGRHIGRHRERSETHKPEALEKGEKPRRYSLVKRMVGTLQGLARLRKSGSESRPWLNKSTTLKMNGDVKGRFFSFQFGVVVFFR